MRYMGSSVLTLDSEVEGMISLSPSLYCMHAGVMVFE